MTNSSARPTPLRSVFFALACALLVAACSGEEASNPSSNARSVAPSVPEQGTHTDTSKEAHGSPAASGGAPAAIPTRTGSSASKGEKAARQPSERPIPAFEGLTLAGTRLTMRDLLGTRLLLFFFNPEVDQAVPVGAAVDSLNAQASDHNFRVVGVGVGSNPSKLGRFVKEHGYSFPVIDDSSGRVKRQIRLQAPVALLGIDADGYVSFGIAHFPSGGDVEAATAEDLRNRLRITDAATSGDGALYALPRAPALDVVSMADGSKLSTSSLAGRAAIVIFFLHTCPHCHRALEAIEGILASIPEEKTPRLVAISVQNSPRAIRQSLSELGLDFFTPYLDPGDQAAERWGVTGGVPVVMVLDADGRIRHRSQGWNEKRDGGMLRMHAARAAGGPAPMLLDPKGYSGNDACGVCHEQEYATWQYTKHSTAFDTLVTHAADRRKDCIGCHVVGYQQKGGYDFARRPAHLENVGCESCHGRGGPHLSPGFVPNGDYQAVCATCHNPAHSLGFEYASFHPRVSHTRIASISNAERAELLGGTGPSRELLPTTADYVGSQACQSCHEQEFETWAASPHGHAAATLEKAGKAGEADCLSCHTTAYGKAGGFPEGGPIADHPDLARVGCESCHGPGGDHIGDDARRVGTTLSLGDKCDSCVILKVCGSCHDDANDPGFEFEVELRVEAQRHGTIESAATRAGQSAFHAHDSDAPSVASARSATHDRARLDRALPRPVTADGQG